MKTFLIAGLSILLSLPVFSQREYISEIRNIKNFINIKNSTSADVYIKKAPEYKVVVETEKENMPKLITELKNNVLYISAKNIKRSKHLVVRIEMPEIKTVSLAGSGDMEIKGMFKTQDFNATLNGSGDVEIKDMLCNNAKISIYGSGDFESAGNITGNLIINISGSGDVEIESAHCNTTKITSNGSGDVEINGESTNLNAELFGSGDIDLGKYKVANVHVTSSGSGDIKVIATNSIDANCSGSGDFELKGNPAKRSVVMTGSGDFYDN